eukprot:jgi/Mesvir1/22775/Mv14165-RA.1
MAKRHDKPTPATEDVSQRLAPVRVDLEIDGRRLKDTFLWDAADTADASFHNFAVQLVKEKGLSSAFVPPLAATIRERVAEYTSLEPFFEAAAASGCVYLLKLDVRAGNCHVMDQVLWDVACAESAPEDFATRLCADLEIEEEEMRRVLAFAIREEMLAIVRRVARDIRSNTKGQRRDTHAPTTAASSGSRVGIPHKELRKSINRGGIMRRKSELDAWEPIVEYLTEREVEALDAKEDREARYKRRNEEREGGDAGLMAAGMRRGLPPRGYPR